MRGLPKNPMDGRHPKGLDDIDARGRVMGLMNLSYESGCPVASVRFAGGAKCGKCVKRMASRLIIQWTLHK